MRPGPFVCAVFAETFAFQIPSWIIIAAMGAVMILAISAVVFVLLRKLGD
jgi:hypothetical protein